ncbi:uncharacterized protein LOC143122048 [Alosa pseudoharengus]|uniref:uncharacterized protein LOC143122048 n=1 Tax=Alosa pseudoharengus TaxID=34774 RepID=UPI003F8C14E0
MNNKEVIIKGIKDPLIPTTSSHGHLIHRLMGVFLLVTVVYLLLLYIEENSRFGDSLRAPYPSGRSVPKSVCGLPESVNPLLQVNGSRTYLVSSYMEHRSRSQIRTIAVVKRTEAVSYSCLFCCDEELKSSDAMQDIHSDHFGFNFGTADILCSVPENCLTLSHVAIYKRPLGIQKPSFLPIRNQQERQESFPYQFTVCISVMYDYTNVLQLVQTLEMFRLLGAQHVAIYKSSCNTATQRVLDYYVKEGFVEIIPWPITQYIKVSRGWQPSVSPGDLHYFGQIAALNDCVYRFMYQTQYVVLQDLDEVIVPVMVNSWTELLPVLEQKYGSYTSFEFENNVFRNTVGGRNAAQRPKEWQGVTGVDILDHVWCEPNDPNAFNNFKVIVNPRTVYRTTVHGLLSADSTGVRVNRDVARNYHIRAPWRQDVGNDKLIRDERLWDYAPRLIPAVSSVLNKTSAK